MSPRGMSASPMPSSRTFDELADVGAAFAAVRDGEVVVDLWGGVANSATGTAWETDTVVPLFSGTKSLVALCLLILANRGQFDLDAPVVRYWPEFVDRGKAEVTVAEVASHRARRPAVRAPLAPADLLDPARLAALLARQPQERDARTAIHLPSADFWLVNRPGSGGGS
ncbi:hypothetical protein FDG2_0393 [Candidatus Protofrankia californiensis]|uniref:Beta-lactamase-related domain-containing protein n=1 Tax=Candidatus Protofrankia californiensis TaxID=1839754 RepID=A0A1C3NTI2_9ACTN|nr:hypothetical protein FDG2_0393 [Candidatus Protofrankia californiensis]